MVVSVRRAISLREIDLFRLIKLRKIRFFLDRSLEGCGVNKSNLPFVIFYQANFC